MLEVISRRLGDAWGVFRGRRQLAREGQGTWHTFMQQGTATGVRVTPDAALTMSAVFGCIRAVVETMATLPLHVYEQKPGPRRNTQIVHEHPLYQLLKWGPNTEMNRVEWLEYMLGHLELRGNAFSEIERVGGRIVGLWPLHPDKMTAKRDSKGALTYEYRKPNGETIRLRPEQVLHFRFFPFDGTMGLSPIKYAARSVGLGVAGQEYTSKILGGDGLRRMALSTEKPLKDEQARQLGEAWKQAYGGLEKADRVAVLHSGLKPETIGISPEDAQLLQLMQATVFDICRIYRVPPHKIMELSRSTNNNIEHQGIEWSVDGITPRCVRLEAVMDRALLGRGNYYFRFNVDGLLRGDFKSRMLGHAQAIQNAIKSPNECRDDEEMNPYEGGDTYYRNGALTPIGEEGKDQKDGKDKKDEGNGGDGERARTDTDGHGRTRTAEVLRPVFEEGYRRLLTRLRAEVLEARGKLNGEFGAWLAEYWGRHRVVAEKVLGPGLEGMRHAGGGKDQKDGKDIKDGEGGTDGHGRAQTDTDVVARYLERVCGVVSLAGDGLEAALDGLVARAGEMAGETVRSAECGMRSEEKNGRDRRDET